MIGTREWIGFWWVPSDEENRLGGTLRVVDGQASLDVLGDFGHEELSRTATEVSLSIGPTDQPRILGLTADGEQLTLVDCSTGEWSSHSSGVTQATYSPRIVLVGAQFDDGDEFSFMEIALRASELDTWVGASGLAQRFTTEEGSEGGGNRITALDIHFEPPTPITIPLDDGDMARIEFRWSSSPERKPLREVRVSHDAWFHLAFGKPRDLEGIFHAAGELRNFLSLAIGRPISVLSVEGLVSERPEENSRQKLKWVQMLWAIPHNAKPSGRPLHYHQMLFTLGDVEPRISPMMRAWFACQELLEPVFNLHFGMLYHPQMYLDVRFLAHAQAIETYDFRRRETTKLPPDEHEKWLATIVDSAPEEHRQRLKTELAGSNLLGLRKRIRDILDQCPTVRDKIVGPSRKDRDKFCTRFVESRNYYTHYNPALEARAARGVALYLLDVQVRAIIEMSLLRILGFSCEEIDAMFARVRRYREIAHFNAMAEAEPA